MLIYFCGLCCFLFPLFHLSLHRQDVRWLVECLAAADGAGRKNACAYIYISCDTCLCFSTWACGCLSARALTLPLALLFIYYFCTHRDVLKHVCYCLLQGFLRMYWAKKILVWRVSLWTYVTVTRRLVIRAEIFSASLIYIYGYPYICYFYYCILANLCYHPIPSLSLPIPIDRSGRLVQKKRCAGPFTSTTSTAWMGGTPMAMWAVCGPSVSSVCILWFLFGFVRRSIVCFMCVFEQTGC